MRILAIETSCDETGIAILETNGSLPNTSFTVLGNALHSQIKEHQAYGGVFPTVAKREHAQNFEPLLLQALADAQLLVPTHTPSVPSEKVSELKILLEREPILFTNLAIFFAQYEKPAIDAIAVTVGPGLEPALWVGVNAARALALAWNIPIVPINHMEGHVIAALVEQPNNELETYKLSNVSFPAIILLVSGGHTELLLMKDWFVYERLGETRDDASGEAFDKSARLLGISYPGGPEISRLAQQAREQKLPALTERLPRPMLHSTNLDFSYSGLKNAVRLLVEKIGTPTDVQKQQIAREVEDAIVETLVHKTTQAVETYGAHSLIVSGGVSANAHLRTALQTTATQTEVSLYISSPLLATDNGLMIAFAGGLRFAQNEVHRSQNISPDARVQLGTTPC